MHCGTICRHQDGYAPPGRASEEWLPEGRYITAYYWVVESDAIDLELQ